MTERSRTLEEILAAARTEPPVVTQEEARALIAHGRTRTTDASTIAANWRGYAMTGFILTAATVIALLTGTPSKEASKGGRDVGTASVAAVPERITAPAQAAQSTDAVAPVSGGGETSRDQGGGRMGTGSEDDDAPVAKPATGVEVWGYRFVEGHTLRYRYTAEHSNPGIGEEFVHRREFEIYVEEVNPNGIASILMRHTLDSFEVQSKPVLPEYVDITVERPNAPNLMRAMVDRYGNVIEGRIVRDRRDNTTKPTQVMNGADVDHWFADVFAVLPNVDPSHSERARYDTATRSYDVPSIGSDGVMSMVTIRDTTRTSYALLGSRKISGQTCSVVVVNRDQTDAHGDGEGTSRSSSINEIYLRKSDGLPMRATYTGTSHTGGGSGSSTRARLELLSEDFPTSTNAVQRPEAID